MSGTVFKDSCNYINTYNALVGICMNITTIYGAQNIKILNKQLWTAGKGWSSSLGVG